MALNREQIDHFGRHGYLPVQKFFTAQEIKAIKAEVRRLRTQGLLRNVATDGDGKTASDRRKNLQLCPLYEHSTLFKALPFSGKVLEAVTTLIGDSAVLQLDQLFLKPAGDGAGTNWHQDNAYFNISDPTKGTAMWIAVDDATVANGTIHVVPDCFTESLEHTRDPDSDHHLHCRPPEQRAVPIELGAGGVAFFCYGTPHCTKGNSTDQDRSGVAYHFVHADHATSDLLAPDRTYNPYLTGPEATGGEREYGRRIAGTWDEEVARASTSA